MPKFSLEAGRQEYMREFLRKIRDKGIYLVEWSGGERIRWARDLSLRDIPTKECLVMRLTYKDKSFLFTSDYGGDLKGAASVCQLPGHGKLDGRELPWAEYRVASSKVVPADERIWSTAREGAIKFSTDGRTMRVKTSK